MPATPMTARESLAVYRHAHSQDVDPSTDYLARAIEEILERLDALESKP